ncbi:MAG: PspC domain-containing protein [Firmicutes bacterium]|nr:PspC domain-containing protein [Bacillota bacterium]
MYKRLRRSPYKKIGGVCGGIAEFFDLDPTIIRLLWIAAVLFFGSGFFFYIICWIVIPDSNSY